MAISSLRTRRQSTKSKIRSFPSFKKILGLTSLLAFLLTILVYLWQPAINISCLTSQNTYCNDDYLSSIDILKKEPWIRSNQKFNQISEQIFQNHPDVIDIVFRRTFPRNIEVEVIKADSLFIANTGSKNWQIFDNSFVRETTEVTQPVMSFENDQVVNNLSAEQSKQLSYLFQKVQNLTPRWKVIRYQSDNEIEAEIENRGKVLLKLGDNQIIDHQLATLQSFFRSSTIDQDYKALDLRFEGLAVVKE